MSDNPKPEAPKSRRGGKRPGAGRKPKGYVKPAVVSALNRVAMLATEPPDEIDRVAQKHARLAVESLVKLLFYGQSEAAKIAAAKEILDRGWGKPAVEIGGDAIMLPFMVAPQTPQAVTLTAEIRAECRKYGDLAITTLEGIAKNGQSESAVASASRALLDRGLGTVGKARMPDEQRELPVGKKEQANRAAELAGTGRYATPAAPRVVSGTAH